METKEFNELVKRQSDAEIATLSAKADEYARGDRLGNFKSMATMLHCTPEKALIGLVAKHWIALLDFIADIDKGVIQSAARWDEKIGDIRAYMTLLKGLVTERMKNLPMNMKSSGYEIHVDPATSVQQNDAVEFLQMAEEIAKHRSWVWGEGGSTKPSTYVVNKTFINMFTFCRDKSVKENQLIFLYEGEPITSKRDPSISCVFYPTGTYTLNDNCPSWVRRVAEKAEKIGIDVKA